MYEFMNLSEIQKLNHMYNERIQALVNTLQALIKYKENASLLKKTQIQYLVDSLNLLLSEKKVELMVDIEKMKRIRALTVLVDENNSDMIKIVEIFQESLLYEKYGISHFNKVESMIQGVNPPKRIIKNYKETSVDKFTYSDYEYGICIDSYNAYRDMTVIVPERINGRPVLKIGDRAFRYCNFLRNIRLPESLRIIGKGAFWFEYPHNLYRINIPYSVDTIKNYAFFENTPEIIYCNNNSYGMSWAKEQGFNVRDYKDFDII